jgi:hypothetical protein
MLSDFLARVRNRRCQPICGQRLFNVDTPREIDRLHQKVECVRDDNLSLGEEILCLRQRIHEMEARR